jgi:hypothetical protein
MGDMIWEK